MFWIGGGFLLARFGDDVYDDDTSFLFLSNEDFVFRYTARSQDMDVLSDNTFQFEGRGISAPIARNSDKVGRACEHVRSDPKATLSARWYLLLVLAHPNDGAWRSVGLACLAAQRDSQASPWLAAVVGRGAQNLVANAMSQLRAPPRVWPPFAHTLDPSLRFPFNLCIPGRVCDIDVVGRHRE